MIDINDVGKQESSEPNNDIDDQNITRYDRDRTHESGVVL